MKLTKEKKLKLKESSLKKWERIVKYLEFVRDEAMKKCGYCEIYRTTASCGGCPLHGGSRCGLTSSVRVTASDAANDAKKLLEAIQKNVKLTRSRKSKT